MKFNKKVSFQKRFLDDFLDAMIDLLFEYDDDDDNNGKENDCVQGKFLNNLLKEF